MSSANFQSLQAHLLELESFLQQSQNFSWQRNDNFDKVYTRIKADFAQLHDALELRENDLIKQLLQSNRILEAERHLIDIKISHLRGLLENDISANGSLSSQPPGQHFLRQLDDISNLPKFESLNLDDLINEIQEFGKIQGIKEIDLRVKESGDPPFCTKEIKSVPNNYWSSASQNEEDCDSMFRKPIAASAPQEDSKQQREHHMDNIKQHPTYPSYSVEKTEDSRFSYLDELHNSPCAQWLVAGGHEPKLSAVQTACSFMYFNDIAQEDNGKWLMKKHAPNVESDSDSSGYCMCDSSNVQSSSSKDDVEEFDWLADLREESGLHSNGNTWLLLKEQKETFNKNCYFDWLDKSKDSFWLLKPWG